MDRIEFLKCANAPCGFENMVVDLYDSIMTIYDLAGMAFRTINVLNIDDDPMDKKSLTFSMTVASIEDANFLYNILYERFVTYYGHKYHIAPEVSEDRLTINLHEN